MSSFLKHSFLLRLSQRQAIMDTAFSSAFTCPPSSSSSSFSLSGTVRAMCRLCQNISNPNNSLVLEGTFSCFPSSLTSMLYSCHSIDASRYEECAGVLGSNDHIDTEYNITSSNGKRTLNYLAMAFRSVSLNIIATKINLFPTWNQYLFTRLTLPSLSPLPLSPFSPPLPSSLLPLPSPSPLSFPSLRLLLSAARPQRT